MGACVAVLMMVFYIAFVLTLGAAVVYHAIVNISLLERPPVFLSLLLYALPILLGVLLFIFMLRPLFAGPGWGRRLKKLRPADEPLLFAFVQRLCETVNAPVPEAIEVDLQVNASASFRGSLFGLLGGELVLTVGLPMIAGLNTRQFAGVVAHELGHFRQGAAMRLSAFVSSVGNWFAGAIYSSRGGDDFLDDWIESESLFLILIAILATLLIFVTRMMLLVVMLLGYAMMCGLQRQMEFDADRYEARLIGSKAFRDTFKRIYQLSIGHQLTMQAFFHGTVTEQFPDNFPRSAGFVADHLPLEAALWIKDALKSEQTGLFSTHPPTRERIQRVMDANWPGIFRLERPATELFGRFDMLARTLTKKLDKKRRHAIYSYYGVTLPPMDFS